MLGVCFGAQFLANHFGGEVLPSKIREYGRANLSFVNTENELYFIVRIELSILLIRIKLMLIKFYIGIYNFFYLVYLRLFCVGGSYSLNSNIMFFIFLNIFTFVFIYLNLFLEKYAKILNLIK